MASKGPKRGGSSGYTRERGNVGGGAGSSETNRSATRGGESRHEQTIKAAREQLASAKIRRNYEPVTIDAGSNGTASITRATDPDMGTFYNVRSSTERFSSDFKTLSAAKEEVARRLRLNDPVNDEERRRRRNNMWWIANGR